MPRKITIYINMYMYVTCSLKWQLSAYVYCLKKSSLDQISDKEQPAILFAFN